MNAKKLLVGASFCVAALLTNASNAAEINQINIEVSKGHYLAHKKNVSLKDVKREAGLNKLYSLKKISSKTDKKGNKHTRYQVYFRNTMVYNQQLITHRNANNKLYRITGFVPGRIEADLKPRDFSSSGLISKSKVLSKLKKLNAKKLRTANTKKLIVQDEKIQKLIYVPKRGPAKLAYLTSFYSENLHSHGGVKALASRPFALIDARNGKVLKQWDGLAHDKIGEGPGGNQKSGKYEYGTDFDHMDITKVTKGIGPFKRTYCTLENDNVKTVNLRHYPYTPGIEGMLLDLLVSQIITPSAHRFNDCPRNTKKEINGAYSPLNDAHNFGTAVFDMYQDWFGVDPLPFQLLMRVHFGFGFENAFWNGKSMTFGDGKSRFYPLVSLDVVSHEVSHGFTETNSGLVYENRSGGINEAFSDMAGEAAEYYLLGANDWMVGEQIFKGEGALRYMDDPTKDGKSIGHADSYYDGLNVHYSSGVYNKAFYLLATTNGWNVKKAFEVMVLANQSYWTPNATYDSAACGVEFAAQDLGYSVSDIRDAFSEVGVQCNN